ncbi:MAG: peptidylprolyl isomerase [Chloroflexi bacterium]|nr:peptidylprolyl isomerase [Chloroflexota bacterium]
MGKKGIKKTAPQPVRLNKRQISRHQREQRLNRATLVGAAMVAVLVVAVLVFGYWREVLAKPGEAIARVNGKPISAQTYGKFLGYTEYNYDLAMFQVQNYINQLPEPQGGSNDSFDFTRQYAQQQLQQLQFRRASADAEVLDNLVDNELVRAEAARRGITVTPDEANQALMAQFNPSNPITQTDPITSTEPGADSSQAITNTKTLPQVLDEFKQALAQTGFLSESEYRYYVLEPSLLTEKLKKAMGDEVKTSGEQIHASHILLENEDDAKKVISMLKDEGRDFASLAQEMSKDTGTKDKGGDLGWFTRGTMVPEFEEAAFKLAPGQISDPVQTSFGYHVIRVEEHEDNKEFSPDQLEAMKTKAYDDWLQNQKKPEQKIVEKVDSPALASWARNYVDNKRRQLAEQAKKAAQLPGK